MLPVAEAFFFPEDLSLALLRILEAIVLVLVGTFLLRLGVCLGLVGVVVTSFFFLPLELAICSESSSREARPERVQWFHISVSISGLSCLICC